MPSVIKTAKQRQLGVLIFDCLCQRDCHVGTCGYRRLIENEREDMEHICDETKLVFVKQEGDLITYRCPECNKEIYSLVCIQVEQLIRQISED